VNGATVPPTVLNSATACSSGTYQWTGGKWTDIAPWTWNCNGSGGGINASCSAIKGVIDGSCGPGVSCLSGTGCAGSCCGINGGYTDACWCGAFRC
jgi:hypothetical protein